MFSLSRPKVSPIQEHEYFEGLTKDAGSHLANLLDLEGITTAQDFEDKVWFITDTSYTTNSQLDEFAKFIYVEIEDWEQPTGLVVEWRASAEYLLSSQFKELRYDGVSYFINTEDE